MGQVKQIKNNPIIVQINAASFSTSKTEASFNKKITPLVFEINTQIPFYYK